MKPGPRITNAELYASMLERRTLREHRRAHVVVGDGAQVRGALEIKGDVATTCSR